MDTETVKITAEDTCECGHIRAGHGGDHGPCLVYARREDARKPRPRPCLCIGFARDDDGPCCIASVTSGGRDHIPGCHN